MTLMVAHPNRQLIEHFYSSFQKLDWRSMQECYHEDAVFYDPVFEDLDATQVRAMWKMLCLQAKDLKLDYYEVKADDEFGSCHWTARYTFSKTNRKVVNRIKAHFKFHQGKFIEHMDDFDVFAWSRQALGASGWLLGWSSFLKNKVRTTAKTNLTRFIEREGI